MTPLYVVSGTDRQSSNVGHDTQPPGLKSSLAWENLDGLFRNGTGLKAPRHPAQQCGNVSASSVKVIRLKGILLLGREVASHFVHGEHELPAVSPVLSLERSQGSK